MARYLNTRGRATLGIGICDRCARKFPLGELRRDSNAPGLRVCRDDYDELDPYRKGLRQAEDVTLPFYRPDASIAIDGGADPVLPPDP